MPLDATSALRHQIHAVCRAHLVPAMLTVEEGAHAASAAAADADADAATAADAAAGRHGDVLADKDTAEAAKAAAEAAQQQQMQ